MVAQLLTDACLLAWALYLVVRLVWRSSQLPPGPLGWPLIGNLFDIGSEAPYNTVGAMTSKYGEYTRVIQRAFGIQQIFLNSSTAIKDLLDRKGAVTSNRPHFTVANDLVGWGNATVFLQYGDTLRKHHKVIGRHIRASSSLVTFHPAEEAEARRFILNVLKNPDDLMAHCHTTSMSLILRITHGYGVKDDGDPFVETTNRALHDLSETMAPRPFLADVFPLFRYLPDWFPGDGFHKNVERWRRVLNEAVNKPHEFVLESLVNGDAVPSLSSRMLQEGLTPEDEEALKWASFTLTLAGVSVTPSMLSAFFLAMTMYPEVFKKAQAEVDTVVGNERLPTMEDRDNLPYVNAICTELLRWNVAVPLVAHVSTQDIIYEGYLIPKGSWLLPNIWFILSNPETYPDPEIFNPERFLGDHQQPDPREVCFGWGRRRCPGEYLVESIIFIDIAMALSTLVVSRRVENGVECVPRYEFEEGVMRHIKPFKCEITPRSKMTRGLLQA